MFIPTANLTNVNTGYSIDYALALDGANDNVATGDQLRVDVDVIQTTTATGLMVELQFRIQ